MDPIELRSLYERKVRLLRQKPSFARATGTSTARLREGLTCDVATGKFELRLDVPEAEGGTESGPTPGQVMRAGLVACLAMGYRQWAVRMGVPIEDVEVEMTCALDARGQLGIEDAGVPSRWQTITWVARITSDAPEADVVRVLDRSDRLSPMLDSLDKAIVLERKLELRRSSS